MALDIHVRPRPPAPPTEAAPVGGVLLVQSAQGLQRVRWVHSDTHSVRRASEAFAELRRRGFRGYRLQAGQTRHEEITQFDPTAHEIVMITPLRGGCA